MPSSSSSSVEFSRSLSLSFTWRPSSSSSSSWQLPHPLQVLPRRLLLQQGLLPSSLLGSSLILFRFSLGDFFYNRGFFLLLFLLLGLRRQFRGHGAECGCGVCQGGQGLRLEGCEGLHTR